MTTSEKIKTTLYIFFVQPFNDLYIDYLTWYTKHLDRRKARLAAKEIDRAIRKADRLHKASGKRFYVLKIHDGLNPIVFCRDDIKELKKLGYLHHNVGNPWLLKHCTYITKATQ